MKIVIAGQDRTADLGAALRAAAAGRPAGPKPAVLPESISALRLRESASEADYLAELLRLLRYRDNVDTLPFDIPRRPGPAGAVAAQIKAVLWKVLRYQHNRVTGRQNMINHLYTSALEFEHRQRDAELRELRQRLAALEQKKE
ncbi:MAG: hypothetical protein NTV49_10845 [Kiritimatiellaeota bacterium]|nr:hypothetical protein [Kiritimatiellota bacterium]